MDTAFFDPAAHAPLPMPAAGGGPWALWDQPRCGEPGAHPTYCIAKPRGLGAVADSMGKVLPAPRFLPAAPYLLHPTP